jgi:hypothetical protein
MSERTLTASVTVHGHYDVDTILLGGFEVITKDFIAVKNKEQSQRMLIQDY